MHSNLSDYIKMRYPLLSTNISLENGKYHSAFPAIECNDGWFHIINNLCASINNYCIENNIKHFRVTQIKEKFGTLRFYVSGSDDTINQLISFAEYMSMSTCEICGNIGTLRNNGWVSTLCDEHNVDKKITVSEPAFRYNIGDVINIHTPTEVLRAKIVSIDTLKVQVLGRKEYIAPVEYKANTMFSYFILKSTN